MERSYFRLLVQTTLASLCLMSMSQLSAQAGQLHNGWNYSIDAFNDGSGGANFEIKGLAIKETATDIVVALTGGTPLTGVYDSGAADKNIGWGDMFFNFSGKNFTTASNSKSLFGVRFAGTNDSLAPSVGLYGNVQAVSVTSTNHGYNSLKQYYDYGNQSPPKMAGLLLPVIEVRLTACACKRCLPNQANSMASLAAEG